MAEHQHLPLPRAQIDLERRKRSGYPGGPVREFRTHGRAVEEQVERALIEFSRPRQALGVDPSLILKVTTAGYTAETDWEAAGLSLLSADNDKTLILFSSDNELREFRRRIDAYRHGPKEGAKTAPYAGVVAAIETVSTLSPTDRIGPILKSEGITSEQSFSNAASYSIDLELWEISPRSRRLQQIQQIVSLIEAGGGDVADRYIGHSMTLLRVVATGAIIRQLLSIPDVRQVERPPMPDSTVGQLLDLNLTDFPTPDALPEGSPSITLIDSGVVAAHPLLNPAIGECIAIPNYLDPSDAWGHGTKVAGIAAYGDVRLRAEARDFNPSVKIHSARVLKDDGKFPDDILVTTQMRNAIEYFNQTHGCKVFNISLGDPRSVYDGGRVSTWAAVLDELAREFNVLIVVSAGNLNYKGKTAESSLTEYPKYLLETASSIYEPASAALAITVGSLSHAAAVPPEEADGVRLRPIAQPHCPSPFTRSGSEIGQQNKPDLCDYGGNLTFDGVAQNVSAHWAPNSIVTLNPNYIRQLLATSIGTSLAAPMVAYKAALVFDAMPNASANLVRALLGSSATVPSDAIDLLEPLGVADAVSRICGLGVPSVGKAIFSDDSRVVLFADADINSDQFYVYEIPLTDEFRSTKGERSITITLAFDPPTRHTRSDYLGTRMSFRLIRGADLDLVTEHFRKRTKEEGRFPDLPGKFNCALEPTSTQREGSTLQRARFVMKRDPAIEYGDTYFLVVRCEGRWAPPQRQRFAVVVEIEHRAVDNLYARVAERVRARNRARA